jgi:hypothetical protein
MSCTLMPLALLKSALQHGVVLLVGALHSACVGTYRVFTPVHAALLATIAHVEPRQHEPVVIGQGDGRQIVPRPRNVLGPTHTARVVTVHAPVEAQQAPVGCGQVTPVHEALEALNVPGHSAATVTVHVPSLAQHAPGAVDGHGLGVQGTAKAQLEMPAQAEYSTEVQAPLERLQQAPSAGCGQGFGLQTAPLVQVLGVVQLPSVTDVHTPVVGLQQAPVGGAGQGFGLQIAPEVQTLVDVEQLAWIEATQLPVVSEQQEPLGGCGQGFVGAQVWPCVHTVPAAVHWICALRMHAPVAVLQHVPDGGTGQMFGEQLLLSVHTLGEAQLAWLVIVQAPRFVQHDPCGGRHGFGGPQVRPAVHTFGAAQKVWNPTTHPPRDVQQVPVPGQGFGEQAPPEMKKFGKAQTPDVPAVQVPSVAQHAPVWARAAPVQRQTPRIAAKIAARSVERGGILIMGILDEWRTGTPATEHAEDATRVVSGRTTVEAARDRRSFGSYTLRPSIGPQISRVAKVKSVKKVNNSRPAGPRGCQKRPELPGIPCRPRQDG